LKQIIQSGKKTSEQRGIGFGSPPETDAYLSCGFFRLLAKYVFILGNKIDKIVLSNIAGQAKIFCPAYQFITNLRAYFTGRIVSH